MDSSDVLATIAEIAITLAGFTGLITVFRQHRPWSSQELTRLQTIVAACFVCMLSALLPLGLAHFSTRSGLVWGVPIAVYAVLHLVILAYLVLRYRDGSFRPSGLASRMVLLLNALISIVLLFAAFAGPSPGLLVLACTWGIVYPAIGFMLTFVMVTRGDDLTGADGG